MTTTVAGNVGDIFYCSASGKYYEVDSYHHAHAIDLSEVPANDITDPPTLTNWQDFTIDGENSPGGNGPNGAGNRSSNSSSPPNANSPSSNPNIASVKEFVASSMGRSVTKEQMQSIADNGYYVDKNGKHVYVPADVQKGAKELMANNGALFDTLDKRGGNGSMDHVLTPGDFDTFKPGDTPPGFGGNNSDDYSSYHSMSPTHCEQVIGDYMKNNVPGGMLSRSQVQSIADNGYYTDKNGQRVTVPPEVQQAAQGLMADGGKRFDQIDKAGSNGKADGWIGAWDINATYQGSSGIPNNGSDGNGGKPIDPMRPHLSDIQRYIHEHMGDYATKQQIQDIAEFGYYTDKNGNRVVVDDPNAREGAKELMANNAYQFNVFDKLGSPNNTQDGTLATWDFQGLHASAFKNWWAGISAGLTNQNLKDLAEKGYYLDGNGNKVTPPPEALEGIKELSANNWALWKKLHDGGLGGWPPSPV